MQVAVLGLGRFGAHLAEALDDLGHEVLAIDLDESNVHELAPKVTDARIADITDIDALRALSLGEVDVAVVATADLEASVLAMMNLKQLEVDVVYAKARSDRHARMLRLLGAQRVIRPERDGAERFAHIIRVASATDFLPLTPSYGIGVFPVPATWVGQTIERALERAGSRRLIALVRGDEVLLNPVMSERVEVGDRFVFSALDEQLGEPVGRPIESLGNRTETTNGRCWASAVCDGSGSGSGIRTHDLRVMSPTSYRCSIPQRGEIVKRCVCVCGWRMLDAALRTAARCKSCCAWRRAGQAVRPLVRLSCTRYRASTCRLSNGSSSRGLIRSLAAGALILRLVSRLDAFSASPVRTWLPSGGGRPSN